MGKVSNIDNERIGLIITARRKERNLTLDVLGTHIGCDHSTLIGYEKGRRPIPAGRVPVLAEALGLDPRIINPQAA